MSCPANELLAAAASGEGVELDAHVSECTRCARELELQRQLIARARSIAVPVLTRPRRMALAAETLARADAARHRGARITLTASFAIAAGVAIVIAWSPMHERPPALVAEPAPSTCRFPRARLPVPVPMPMPMPVPAPVVRARSRRVPPRSRRRTASSSARGCAAATRSISTTARSWSTRAIVRRSP